MNTTEKLAQFLGISEASFHPSEKSAEERIAELEAQNEALREAINVLQNEST